MRIISESPIIIFNSKYFLWWDCQGLCALMFVDGIFEKWSIMGANGFSWVWEPDINNSFIDMKFLVKSDAMF